MRWIALFALVPFALGAIPRCEKTIIAHQHTFEAQGLQLNFTISECAGADKKHHKPLTDAEVRAVEKRSPVLDTSLDFEKRQTNQCVLPAPNCICDVGCTNVQCFAPRGPVSQTDCAQLGLALIQTAGSFLIQPGQFAGVTYKTCTYAIYNNEATNLQEYCYNVLGHVAFTQLCIGCPNEEALCGGGTLLGVSRFYVDQITTSII